MKPFAQYYDVIYGDRDYNQDIAAFRQIVQKDMLALSLLEIGAGTGNHTVRLAPLVKKLTAVEVDEDFAALARQKIAAARLAHVEIKTGYLKKAITPAYDTAAAFFHVVNYIPDEEAFTAFLQALASQLKPGAVFVFDFWNAEGVRADPPRHEKRVKTVGGYKVEQEIAPTLEDGKTRVKLHYSFTLTPPGGEPVRFEETLMVRLWPRMVLESLFGGEGFAALNFWDSRAYPQPLQEKSLRGLAAFAKQDS